MEKNNKKTIVYTAIFGDRDKLSDPKVLNENFEYVCFTDNPNLTSKIWKIKLCSPISPDPVISAKLFKVLPQKFFPEFEKSIWIDGNMIVAKDLSPLLDLVDDETTLACFDHNLSKTDSVNCIYDEANLLLKKISEGKHHTLDPKPIIKQVERLKKEGYPEQNGLISGNLLIRKHMNKKCIQMMEEWWSEILSGSRRDELSFNYLAWKNGFKFKYIDGDFKDNKWFIRLKHSKFS
jgi:lipopolysaccharide biosynthesis glycosyltransferase